MVRLREIPRTATFAWSPGTASPCLATGTRAGAVDADFSNDTQLELWDLNLDNTKQGHELQPTASIDTDSRFHDIAWVQATDDFPKGVIAGALENGSLDLWNAEKLFSGQGESFMSRTSKHSGAIKTLQFNPFRPELLATAGAKGELFISDLNNIHNPFRMGNSVARADDFECLDWNKNVPHIMVTGSNGGFVTVWDVKTKKESLTLNNLGRKAVSAVAWDPDKHTRLVTAIPHDTDPLILVWDLRNSNAPERVLRGHDGGVLSLSWCSQDNDLLLSCGKDNRTICWNPQTGESYGDFDVVTNWTFLTRWNPHNPNILATASFDGKIGIQSIQNTNADANQASGSHAQQVDDESFFNKTQSQPQGASFSLQKAPRWLERSCGASFGFGGKVLSFTAVGNSAAPRTSTLRISTFVIDARVGTSTNAFEKALNGNDLKGICESKIIKATLETEKADWKVIETLTSENPRKELIKYLGFSSISDEASDRLSTLAITGESKEEDVSHLTEPSENKPSRLSAFFESSGTGDSFLSDLAATKGAKTNNPFQIYTGSESEPDKTITHALLLGQFDKALDVCLQEDRLSDAFMVAICGGQACIDKAQKAYLGRKSGTPNYLRLLASVAGKNLWDVVYNAELNGWKEVMAVICTYATAEEFPDLCDALGDRLDEHLRTHDEDLELQKSASFCYLASSKLEKVVTIWLAKLDKHDETSRDDSETDSFFSVHARSLQRFIEKVTVFREVTHFQDSDQNVTSAWRLRALYDKYIEFADIIASHGQLETAEKYLDLLPEKYPAAEIARNRIKQAISRPTAPKPTKQPADPTRSTHQAPPNATGFHQHQNIANPVAANQRNPYASYPPIQPQNSHAQPSDGLYSAAPYVDPTKYQQPQQSQQQDLLRQSSIAPPISGAPYQTQKFGPPRNFNASPSIPPPSKAQSMGNWNDTPESFFKPPTSRRGTPGVSMSNPATLVGYPGTGQSSAGPSYGVQPKSTSPLPPPPKSSIGPPPRLSSPATSIPQPYQPPERPTSSAASAYAPQQSLLSPGPVSGLGSNPTLGFVQQQQPTSRGPSPYNAPPSAPPPSNRYAPLPSNQASAPSSQVDPSFGSGSTRPGPPPINPYSPLQNHSVPSNKNQAAPLSQGPPPKASTSLIGPPQGPAQGSRPEALQNQRSKTGTPSASKYPPGDRSHIPAGARAIFEILGGDMQRVKARAPQSFKPQVMDTEKRLNILFDHLNNEDLLKEQTVQDMVQLAQALQARNYEQAQTIHIDIMTNRTEECGNWMVGVKRLIGMSRATP